MQASIEYTLKNQQATRKLLKKIAQSVSTPETNDFSKKSLIQYLNTFAFQIGSDIPSDQEIRKIYNQLEDKTINAIPYQQFLKLIQFCLDIYVESKKDAIGGIFMRLHIKIRSYKLNDKEYQQQQELIF